MGDAVCYSTVLYSSVLYGELFCPVLEVRRLGTMG